jgi:ribosomal protein L3 glutamine methyltransferase
VPRSFLAPMILDHLQPWLGEPENVQNALDLCTGSGCLAILLAEAFQEAKWMRWICRGMPWPWRRNVADYGLAGQVRLVQGDLFAPGR